MPKKDCFLVSIVTFAIRGVCVFPLPENTNINACFDFDFILNWNWILDFLTSSYSFSGFCIFSLLAKGSVYPISMKALWARSILSLNSNKLL